MKSNRLALYVILLTTMLIHLPAYAGDDSVETSPEILSRTSSEAQQGLVEVSSNRIVLPYWTWMFAVGLLLIIQVISILSITKGNRRLQKEHSIRKDLERRAEKLEDEKPVRNSNPGESTHIDFLSWSGHPGKHSLDDTMKDTKASLETIISFSSLLLDGDPSDENRAIVEIINEVANKALDTAGDIFSLIEGIPGLSYSDTDEATIQSEEDLIKDLMDELLRAEEEDSSRENKAAKEPARGNKPIQGIGKIYN